MSRLIPRILVGVAVFVVPTVGIHAVGSRSGKAVVTTTAPAVVAPGGNCAVDDGDVDRCGPSTVQPSTAAKPEPIVIQDDTTSFPVAEAYANWDLPGVTIGACTHAVRCILVTETASLRAAPAPGVTASGHTTWSRPGVATVVLVDTTPRALRLEDTSHELGHAFGLHHDPSGCMEAVLHGLHQTPSQAERARALANIGAM